MGWGSLVSARFWWVLKWVFSLLSIAILKFNIMQDECHVWNGDIVFSIIIVDARWNTRIITYIHIYHRNIFRRSTLYIYVWRHLRKINSTARFLPDCSFLCNRITEKYSSCTVSSLTSYKVLSIHIYVQQPLMILLLLLSPSSSLQQNSHVRSRTYTMLLFFFCSHLLFILQCYYIPVRGN